MVWPCTINIQTNVLLNQLIFMKGLKLTTLSEKAMERREMNNFIGGKSCTCGCNGPSGVQDNGLANHASGLTSHSDHEITIH